MQGCLCCAAKTLKCPFNKICVYVLNANIWGICPADTLPKGALLEAILETCATQYVSQT